MERLASRTPEFTNVELGEIGKLDATQVDDALDFLYRHNQTGPLSRQTGPIDERRLLRRIDWRIIPIMFVCYTCQFLDKVNLNVSLFNIRRPSRIH